MLANGSGYILSTVSAAGLLTNIGAAPYAVTKHAALALAEWVSMTYGKQGIGVSALCPQFVDTPMLELFGESASQDWVRSIAITTDDVADAVIEGLDAERFLILPHPEVATFFQNKANDYDRWLGGMRKLNEQLNNPDFG
jgi:short-subunit dehydrogenase